jgi:acetate kinase
MRALVFNCGSSSLKFDFIELDALGVRGRSLGHGLFEEIGRPASGNRRLVDAFGAVHEQAGRIANHPAAALEAIAALESAHSESPLRPDVIAHRFVHGGPDLTVPAIADEKILKALEAASVFDPLHYPASIATLRAVAVRLPQAPAVVIADTVFHRTIPECARDYALPRTLAARHRIHRYGFHGPAHAWMMERYAELRGVRTSAVNLITLQLGAGCSATAIRNGVSIDTSMGLTPLEGLMMATRSGDLDPAIVGFLVEREGITAAKVVEMLNHECGLRGVSGISNDLREIEAAAHAGNRDAALAIQMFCYRVRKYIGAYLAALGGADAIVFGGGIGEHSAAVRAEICEGLKPLGIELDSARNQDAVGREERISADGASVEAYVIPVNEELYMARVAARVIAAGDQSIV